jgi:hypothetical protein
MTDQSRNRGVRAVLAVTGVFVIGYTFFYGEARFMEPRAVPVIALVLGLGLALLLWIRAK